MDRPRSAALAVRRSVRPRGPAAIACAWMSPGRIVESMDEEQGQHHGDHDPQADHGPGRGAVAGVQFQQHQTGQRKDQTGHGEHVQEPAPGQAGIAALVQVVQVRDPAPVGAFVFDVAAGQVDRQPGVAAGARQRQVDFIGGPFGRLAGGGRVSSRSSQRDTASGSGAFFRPGASWRSASCGSVAWRVVTTAFDSIWEALFSVSP